MANLYNIADRVEVIIRREEDGVTTENPYAATVITYETYKDESDQDAYRYRLSVDGWGDTLLAEESDISQIGG